MNEELKESSASAIIGWALSHKKIIATTNFGPHEAVMMHHISKLAPEMPVICIDHGYNTEETYRVAEELRNRLKLNVFYYTPKVTRARRDVIFGGVPDISQEQEHRRFVEEVKLEPFARAFDEHKPEIWLTSLRKDQTEFRAGLNVLTEDRRFGCLKVSPFLYWSELDMENYLVENNLPIVEDYNDPTKVYTHRECGLHIK